MILELRNLPLQANKKTKRAFIKWADCHGWQPYDSLEMWVNLLQGRKLRDINELFELFQKEVLIEHELH